jgi:hypothetical protein
MSVSQSPGKRSLGQRWEAMQPSKTVLAWSCVACTAGAVLLGFTWGGWVTGGSARSMADAAAAGARDQLVASICVDRFQAGSDATAQLVALKELRNWDRGSFIEKGGWVAMPDKSVATTAAARLCAEQLAAL